MGFRKRVAQLDLIPILAMAVMAELTLNRLAVPVLRPTGERLPPTWHRNLDVAGLFVFHLASALALGATVWKLWEMVTTRGMFSRAARISLAAVGLVFTLLTAWSIVGAPARLGFHLETSLAALLLLILIAVAIRPGDPWIKAGLALVAVPFLVHYYGTFRLTLLHAGEGARWSTLPDQVRELGTWSLAACAVLSPVCFAPRPIWRALSRPGPVALSAFVGTIGAVILRRHYEVGSEIASRGLGIELGPAAPVGAIMIYVVGLTLVAWTLAATLTTDTFARRNVGMGLLLFVAAGYGFSWPLQLCAAAVGALVIAQSAASIREEEQAADREASPPKFASPPIPDAAWRAYLDALGTALGARPKVVAAPEGETITLAARRGPRDYLLRLERSRGSVGLVEATFGEAPEAGVEPAWTLASRPEGVLAVGHHPAPPATRAPAVKTGDPPFDRRFRVHDAATHTARLLDEGLRARAAASLDGWLAFWPGRSLRYRVHPGRGAPLDHPIPVTELAVRGEPDSRSAARLVSLVDLLGDIADRALPAGG